MDMRRESLGFHDYSRLHCVIYWFCPCYLMDVVVLLFGLAAVVAVLLRDDVFFPFVEDWHAFRK